MRKRTGARGTAMVEYAMLVIALMVGGAAAKKAVGARVTDAASQAIVALGGNAIASESRDGRSGVTQLPKVGAGPNATKEEMAAADKNKDGVLSPEEQLALQMQQQKENERVALASGLEKKRHETLSAFLQNLKP